MLLFIYNVACQNQPGKASGAGAICGGTWVLFYWLSRIPGQFFWAYFMHTIYKSISKATESSWAETKRLHKMMFWEQPAQENALFWGLLERNSTITIINSLLQTQVAAYFYNLGFTFKVFDFWRCTQWIHFDTRQAWIYQWLPVGIVFITSTHFRYIFLQLLHL